MTVLSLPTSRSDELLLKEIAERIDKTHPFSAIQLRAVAERVQRELRSRR
ncbi:hypothetical protein [Mycobacterium sp. NPDC050853]